MKGLKLNPKEMNAVVMGLNSLKEDLVNSVLKSKRVFNNEARMIATDIINTCNSVLNKLSDAGYDTSMPDASSVTDKDIAEFVEPVMPIGKPIKE